MVVVYLPNKRDYRKHMFLKSVSFFLNKIGIKRYNTSLKIGSSISICKRDDRQTDGGVSIFFKRYHIRRHSEGAVRIFLQTSPKKRSFIVEYTLSCSQQ
jgi:hypothetical protein